MGKGTASRVDVLAVSPSEARTAFDAVRARMDAVAVDDLVPIRVDVQAAAALAHSIAVRDAASDRKAVFDRLAKADLFDMTQLDSLADLSLAAWHARQQQQLASGQASGATIPVKVFEDAQSTRDRMLRVLDYYFADDTTFGPKLGIVHSGSGYQDLANDLEILADLYQDSAVQPLIVRDPMHYRAVDIAHARELASSIFASLGLGKQGDAQRWAEATQKAWSLLSRAYDKVRQAGQYIFAGQEDVEATYPSLVSYVRAPAVRRPAEPEPPPPPQPAPVS
jgi:hypothetical protein